MRDIEELKDEAASLGIPFSPNIGAAKLQEKLDAYYAQLNENGEPVDTAEEEEEVATPVVAVPVNSTPVATKVGAKETPSARIKRLLQEDNKKRNQPRLVKVSVVDKREASTATTVYVGNAADGYRIPVDTFVELDGWAVAQLEKATFVNHITNPATGLSSAKLTKKYVLEYKQ